MTENWVPVLLENGGFSLNGNNIVLQNKHTNEIGYAENTSENRSLFGLGLEGFEVNECESEITEACMITGKIEWGTETKLLLDLYYEYLPQVGPMKRFKSKKKMWDQISEDIHNKLNITRSAIQCESRFKTMKRRKSTCQMQNKMSGNAPTNVAYEDEFNKIKSIDDTIEPEVLIDVTHKVVNPKDTSKRDASVINDKKSCSTTKKQKSDKIVETLLVIHKEKEASREKRHREKMEILESFLKNKKNCNR